MKLFGYNISSRNGNTQKTSVTTTEMPLFSSVIGKYGRQQMTAMNLSAVFRAIDLISDSVACLPIETENEDTQALFDNITPYLGRYEWLKLTVQSIIKFGQSFTYIEKKNGIPYRLRFLTSSSVNVNYNELTDELTYTVTGKKGILNVAPSDMLHFRRFTWNGVDGKSILTFASSAIEIASKTENSASEYFDSDFKGLLSSPDNLSPTKQREIETNFSYFLQNKSAAVLSGGLTFQELKQDNANDSQLIEAREFNVKDIARFFGIPQQLLTGESGAYNSLEQAQQEFLTRTLQPYITLIEQELSMKLHENIQLNEGEMLRLSTSAKADYLNKLLSSGVISINEAREEISLEPIEGGDKHIIAYTNINDNTINDNGEKQDNNK